MDALGRLMTSPGGFIASWALGTCPQKCHVSLFGLSTLHGKSVPWHQDKIPHDVHESRVKRDRVSCFLLCWSFIDGCVFLNIYIYKYIYMYIFVIKCLALVWKNTAQTDTWQDQLVAPPRPSHSSSRIFEAAFSWGSGRCSVEERPIRRGICYLQRQRHSQPPDEFYYPSKVKTCWNSLVEYPPVFFTWNFEYWLWFPTFLPLQDIYLLLLVELQMERGPIAVPLAMHQCNVEIECNNLLQMALEIQVLFLCTRLIT